MRGFAIVLLAGVLGFQTAALGDEGEPLLRDADQIIGGSDVESGDEVALSTVAIVNQLPNGRSSICTGSLLSSDIVLTAAHCVGPKGSKTYIVFRKDLKDSGHAAPITGAIRHPDYGSTSGDVDQNDIAVMSFDGGLPDDYEPAELLEDESPLRDGAKITLAGFGVTIGSPALRSGTSGRLHAVTTTLKQAFYGETESLTEQSQGRGACHGDSGGPAFIRDGSGRLKLFGVTSRGPSHLPDDCGAYGIYTRASAHLDFIYEAAGQLSP